MTPMVKIERDPASAMQLRQSMLRLPPEVFREYFDGRIPTLLEKTICIEKAVQTMAAVHVYENDLYHVDVNYTPPFAHLAIRRHDGLPCKEWMHFQQIKNEIIGPEHEAMELFPAESRLVNSANEYHLWVHTNSSYRFPVGFCRRFVLSDPAAGRRAMVRQGVPIQISRMPRKASQWRPATEDGNRS